MRQLHDDTHLILDDEVSLNVLTHRCFQPFISLCRWLEKNLQEHHYAI